MRIALPTDKISSRERYLEAIVQSVIDYAIISLDLDGIVTSWNDGAQNILGWSADEMIGKPATAFFTQEDRENGVPLLEMTAALQKGRGSDERWHLRADGSCFWASGEMMALRTEEEQAIGFVKILRDRTAEREQVDRQRLMMHELSHRMKNTLSVVQSIAMQSMRSSTSLDDAREKLLSRISAYSRAHDILLQTQWLSAMLSTIVETARAAIGWEESDRIRWSGPKVTLGPDAALAFSMVFHELLTNACKYGALSNEVGNVKIDWCVADGEDGDIIRLSWREFDGPEVSVPDRNGFGSRLISSSLRSYGDPVISYEPGGFALDIDMPLSKVQYKDDLARVNTSA